MSTFTVVDVETANHSRASVCQIGQAAELLTPIGYTE